MPRNAPTEPPPDKATKPEERFMLTVSCPPAALVTIAVVIIIGILSANGFDPTAVLEVFAKSRL